MATDMKMLIAEHFDALVRQRGIDKVTVKAVIEDCGISRQTFYYHFKDLMDLLEWHAQRMTERMIERSLKAETPQAALSEFVRTMAENRALLHKLISSQRRGQVERILFGAVRTYLEELLRRSDKAMRGEYRDAGLALDLLAFGLTGILIQRCSSDQELDPDRLAEQLLRILGERI